MVTKSYAKKETSRATDVETLAKWAKDEIDYLKNECAVEILELAKNEEGDRAEHHKAIADKMIAFGQAAADLQKIIDWCERDPEVQQES